MKTKQKINWGPKISYLVAFFVPLVIMIGIFAAKRIFPFGHKTFLQVDLYHQYAPFLQSLKDKISSGGSLFYSWNIGLGTNYLALLAYYLASPVNILVAICPDGYVLEFLSYAVVIKMALSSVTMTYYLNKHSKTNTVGSALFGIFYGLSGFLAAYSWNIMWIDCILLLPLIILGLERLVKEDKGFLYSITLGISIFSNYYIAIMICITMVIYFIVQIILLDDPKAQYWKKFLNFGIYSLLAGGIAAIVLIPEIYALQMTASSSSKFPSSAESYFSIFDMMSRHLINVKIHTGLDHWPNIFCGVAIFMFIPLFAMNSRIRFKEKMSYFILVLFFYLSFSLNVLNYIWHGLHFPNSLPARQSFIYIFFILTMAFKGFNGVKERSSKQIIGSIWIAVAFVILAEKLVSTETAEYLPWHAFYISLALIAIYGGLTWLYRKGKTPKDILAIVAVFFVIVEATTNMAVTGVRVVSRDAYVSEDASLDEMLSLIEEEEGANSFYRVEKRNFRTKNDGAWQNYRSASIFSSTANKNLTDFYKLIGLESSTNAYGSMGASWFTNMFLGVKYIIYNSNTGGEYATGYSTYVAPFLHEDDLQEEYMELNGIYIYKNNYALPLGFMVDQNLNSSWNTSNPNPVDNINNLALQLTDRAQLFKYSGKDTKVNESEYRIEVEEDGYVYLYCPKSGVKSVRIVCSTGEIFDYSFENNSSLANATDSTAAPTTSTNLSKSFDNLGRNYLISLGYHEVGESIRVINSDEGSNATFSVSPYVLNEDVLKEMYQKLAEEPMVIDSFSDTHIEAHVTTASDRTLLTTIPYEPGWTVKVDGVVVEPAIFKETFISIPLSAGSHDIEFSYIPQGFYLGLLLTIVSIACLVLLYVLQRQLKKRNETIALAATESNKAAAEAPAIKPAHSSEAPADNEQDEAKEMKTGIKPDEEADSELTDVEIEVVVNRGDSTIVYEDSDDFEDMAIEEFDVNTVQSDAHAKTPTDQTADTE